MPKVFIILLLLPSLLFANSFIVQEVAPMENDGQKAQSLSGDGFVVAVLRQTSPATHCQHTDTAIVNGANGVSLSLDNGKTWSHTELEDHVIAHLLPGQDGSVVAVTERDRHFQISLNREREIGDNVEFLNFPPTKSKTDPKWGPVLIDIMSHEVDFNNYKGLITLAHETTHGIHAHIRNNMNKTGKKANGFYVLEDRAVVVVEPNMRKSQIAKFVPPSLREYRYSVYVTGQTSWDDYPLYIWDEWNAYVNGSQTGVELVELGKWTYPWQDGVMGTIEFVVYSIATAMAVKEHDPEYFQNYQQFREFLAWNVKRSMVIYKKGCVMDAFKWDRQDKYYENMKSSPDAEQFRKFCRELFGAQWTLENLGF